jgi:hypothetical protein
MIGMAWVSAVCSEFHVSSSRFYFRKKKAVAQVVPTPSSGFATKKSGCVKNTGKNGVSPF